jgi:predicted amidohydrolase
MTVLRMAAVAAPFDRDLDADLDRIAALVAEARGRGVRLLALPEAALGGYVSDLGGSAPPPPALRVDGPEIRSLVRMAGEDMVVVAGFCEDADPQRYNSAVAVGGGEVLSVHRKVHQPLGEGSTYAAGSGFAAFDTPVGRIGMLICYDKAFPEASRTMALDGAEVLVFISAWPAAATDPAPNIADDRWTRRFDLHDRARALENQVVVLSANQSGAFGSLTFVGSAKIVDPGGDVLATTGVPAGLAVAELDLDASLTAARRYMGHLRDRRPDAYGPAELVVPR